MKRVFISILGMVIILSAVGCSGGGAPKSPAGSFEFGSTAFKLDNKGAFWLEHVASGNDRKHYTVSGTYTYTHDHTDTENEISYGKIDITITGLTLDGAAVSSLDFTTIHTGIDASVGEKLPGWWKFMNLITYGGKMHLGMSLPFRGFRAETVDSGSDWLVIGDPK